MDKLSIVWFTFCVFSIHVESGNLFLSPNRSDIVQPVIIVECTSTGKNQWEQQPHPTVCGWFVLCMNDIGIVSQCPGELLFNPEIMLCDLPENVNCDEPTTTVAPEEPTTETTPGNDSPTDTTDEFTTENGTTVVDTTTEEGSTDETTTEQGTTDETTTEEGTTVDTTTEEGTTDETTTEAGTTDETTTEQGTTDETTTEEGTTVETTTDDETTDDTTTENGTTADTTTEDGTTIDTTPEATTDPEGTTTDPETTTDQSETTSNVTTEENDSTVENGTTEGATESECEPLCEGIQGSFGEIADPNHCDRFISCTNHCSGGTMFCPSNLHFNPIMFVCDLPERAECLLEVCDDQPNGIIPSVNSCRHYFGCKDSNAISQSCGVGLVFDPESERCETEDPDNPCVFPEIPSPPQEVYSQCSSTVVEQQLRHPTRCDVFYRCVRGMLSNRICLEGLLFDETLGKCNLAELVDCNDETEQQ